MKLGTLVSASIVYVVFAGRSKCVEARENGKRWPHFYSPRDVGLTVNDAGHFLFRLCSLGVANAPKLVKMMKGNRTLHHFGGE